MRVVPFKEKKKRGCWYCTDMTKEKDHGCIRTVCPHDACLYHLLDKYNTYEEFMESEDSRILVNEFFQTKPDCYELGNGNVTVRQIYGGSASELHL